MSYSSLKASMTADEARGQAPAGLIYGNAPRHGSVVNTSISLTNNHAILSKVDARFHFALLPTQNFRLDVVSS